MSRIAVQPSCHVVSLRPVGAHEGMRRAAARHGWRLLALSPWRLQPRDDAASRAALSAALGCDCVIVTSPAAVAAADALQPLRQATTTWLAVGEGTRHALQRHGVQALLSPGRMDSEGLLDLPPLRPDAIDGHRVGMLTAPEGRGRLQSELQSRGARLIQADVYDRVPVQPSPQAVARLLRLPPPVWLALSSGQALQRILQALPNEARDHLLQARVVAASQRLGRLAVDAGFLGPVIAAASALPDALMAAIAAGCADTVCSAAPVR